MTEEEIQKLIEKVNSKAPFGQGIYIYPRINESEYVIYSKYETGGYSGGSCWNDDSPEPYYVDERPNFDILEILLNELLPKNRISSYKEMFEKLIKTHDFTDYEYYGNSTDYNLEYIPLSTVLIGLKNIKLNKILNE